jgi:hypothetical protein
MKRTTRKSGPRALARPIVVLLFLLFLCNSVVMAQSLEQWTAWGDAAMLRKEYYGASRFYAGALEMESGRMVLQWKMAEACRLSNQYDKAAELYDRVYRKDQGRTYKEALRWLGEMQLSLGDYDAAKSTWEKVLHKERDKEGTTAHRARNAIAGCALATAALASPTDHRVEHLSAPVNTYDSEFGARIGPDERLYFSSLRGDLNKDGEVLDTAAYRTVVLRSARNGDRWNSPEVLPRAINSGGDNGNTAWTLDGKQMLFTRCATGQPCRIHIAEVMGDGFGEAQPLPGLGEAHSTQPMVVDWDGREMLLFVSDRPGGEGGMDIWQARLEHGTAVEMHPVVGGVNTPGNETGPWFDVASSTLWFSSDFHPGMGGYDIFTSRFDHVFGAAVHMGHPLNSPANDLYPVVRPEAGEGWLTSNRIGSFAAKGETCCNDLYRFTLPASTPPLVEDIPGSGPEGLTHTVAYLRSFTPLRPLMLYFHNDDPEPRSWSTTTQQDYATAYRRYRSLLPDYLREGDREAFEAFFRNDVDRGYLELAELVLALQQVLDAGTSATLHVRGHASPLARNAYNRNLSMRRIESLGNHLRMVLNGRLRPYLDGTAANGAQLRIHPLPFGEDQAPAGVSDDLRDTRRSVYAVEASRERRIQVEAIALSDEGTEGAGFETLFQGLGTVKQDQEREVVFRITNRGTTPMRLLDSKADCGCTAAELPRGDVPPGASVPVVVHFNGRAPEGPLRRTVMVRTNGRPGLVELVIDGVVVP